MNSSNLLELVKNSESPYCYYLYCCYLEGQMDYIHYGYFENGNETIYEAQDKLATKVKALIPNNITKILDSGCGIGRTTWDLTQKGYDVTGITPHGKSLDIARENYPTIAPKFVTSRYEDFSANNKFDLILFQESSQYIDVVSIFRKAAKLLTNNGYILICDEVRYLQSEKYAFNYKVDMIEFAKIFNFELNYNENITNKIIGTREKFVNLLKNNKEAFFQHFSKSRPEFEVEFNNLIDGWANETVRFKDELYGYEIFLFQRTKNHLRSFTENLKLVNHAIQQIIRRIKRKF